MNLSGWHARLVGGLMCVGLLPGTTLASGRSHLLIVSGLGGDPTYEERFYEWSTALMSAATERLGLEVDDVLYYAEKPEREPKRIRGESTKENVVGALESLAQRVEPGDQVFVFLIGHGTSQGGQSKFNLPGRDLEASELADLLSAFDRQRVVVINASSASGGWVEALSGANRVVITATKSGSERNETFFGEYFIEALAQDGADVDKNGRVSLLEAYEYARRNVERTYEEDNRLQTEHSLLEDDGDGQGSHVPLEEESSDGVHAREIFLARGPAAGISVGVGEEATDDPELAALYEEQRQLEQRVEALKEQRDAIEPDVYLEELERLLVELALKRREIEEWKASHP